MSDHYKTLGIEKTATAAEIKKAFYVLAGKYHPDKPDGNEAKFKEINTAYQTLSDNAKRAQYDRYGDAGAQGGFGGGAGGNPFGGFDFSQFGGGNGGFEFQFGGDGNIDLGDIMSQMFGGGRRTPRGRTVQARVHLTFAESIYGATKKVMVPQYENGIDKGEKELSITIPGGVDHGTTLEIANEGEKVDGGNTGSLHILVSVERDSVFTKDGYNIITKKSVKLTEVLLGGEFNLNLPNGKSLAIDIPLGTTHGQVLRARGKGVTGPRGTNGDLLIVIEIQMPKKLSKEAKKAIELLRAEGL
jgi:molecular chaperone DnaJ